MRRQSRGPERLTLYLSVLASMAYLGGGIGLIASSQSFSLLSEPIIRYGLAILLLVYGSFRAYRAYQSFRNDS
jgi:hypothetical protein